MSYYKFRPRRSTSSEWNLVDPVLMEGELGIEYPDAGIGTGLCKFKIGDGYSKWSALSYAFNAASAESIYGGTVSVSKDICLRTGTTDEWETANPILGIGEIVYDITKQSIKVGDGQHAFNDLMYIGYTWTMDDDYDFGDIDEAIIVPGPDDIDYDFGDLDASL